MVILGLESTCDETSVGIVEDGVKIISNIVASSALMHKKYGGIVPEVAAREQVRVMIPTIEEAFKGPGIKYLDVDAIAVASGPGLIGSLLIGVETAKALAIAWNKPLIWVNHLVGHVYANWLNGRDVEFPLIALIVSGGHTDLIFMKDHRSVKWLGGTKDDAAGEVFDKVARLLGLPYPGGPQIETAAAKFTGKTKVVFPRPMKGSGDFDFSFSGLKTAVSNFIKENLSTDKNAVSFAFEEAICDVLVSKTISAAKEFDVKSIVVGGGVSANLRLRKMIENKSAGTFKIHFPERSMSVDNGAMIASAAFFQKSYIDPSELVADSSLYFV